MIVVIIILCRFLVSQLKFFFIAQASVGERVKHNEMLFKIC